MSIKHRVTFSCDACETEFIIDERHMDLPSGWIGLQIVVANSDGCIPEHEQEVFEHFCSQKCLTEYAASDEVRTRLAMADAETAEEEKDEDI